MQKLRLQGGSRPAPTHVILDGIGHPLSGSGRFTIGVGGLGADVTLPDTFNGADDCTVPLVRENGRLWFVDTAMRSTGGTASAARMPVESGDRLVIRCGNASADVLFAHCNAVNGGRAHD